MDRLDGNTNKKARVLSHAVIDLTIEDDPMEEDGNNEVKKFYRKTKNRDDLQTFHGYGTTTFESTNKILSVLLADANRMKTHFIDIGSGWGNVVYHVAAGFKIVSTGLEIEENMCEWSSKHCAKRGISIINKPIQVFHYHPKYAHFFKNFKLDGFTHVYTYDKIFPQDALSALAERLAESSDWLFFASYHSQQEWSELGLSLNIVDTIRAKTAGKQIFSCYIYERNTDV
jgi:hypothetical protein